MNSSIIPAGPAAKGRFRQILPFPWTQGQLSLLRREVGRNSSLFGSIPARTVWEQSPHRDATDILLRYIPGVSELLPGASPSMDPITRAERFRWASTTLQRIDFPCLRHFPLFDLAAHELAARLGYTQVGSLVIAKLPAGGHIYPHSDLGDEPELSPSSDPSLSLPPALYYDRFQLILQGSQVFWVEGEPTFMQAGELWWFDNAREHSLDVYSTEPRIAYIIDLGPAKEQRS